MKKIFIAFLVALVAFTAAVAGGLLVANQYGKTSSPSLGANDIGVGFTVIGTSSPMSVTTSSGQVLATSTGAQWRMFQNNSALPVYLYFGSDKPALANQGIYLAASSTISLDAAHANLYLGAVTAISPGGTVTILVNQK